MLAIAAGADDIAPYFNRMESLDLQAVDAFARDWYDTFGTHELP